LNILENCEHLFYFALEPPFDFGVSLNFPFLRGGFFYFKVAAVLPPAQELAGFG